MLNLQHPFPTLNQEANTTGVLLTIDSPLEYIVGLTYLPPFPVICPGTIRSWAVLLCYAGCVAMRPVTHNGYVARQLLHSSASCCPRCAEDMTYDATDRFMPDVICGCYCTERFFLLHDTPNHGRPLRSRNTVFGALWPWPPMLHNRRMTALRYFILSQQALYLLIQFPSRCKEEVENW
jgi:hypothetical protein